MEQRHCNQRVLKRSIYLHISEKTIKYRRRPSGTEFLLLVRENGTRYNHLTSQCSLKMVPDIITWHLSAH